MKNDNPSCRFQESNKVLYLKSLLLIIFVLLFLKGNAQYVGRTEDGFHIISSQGEKLTQAYDFIQFDEYGFDLASQNGKFAYLNNNGSIAIPFMYDVAYPFDGNFALVGNAGKYYHINKANLVLDSLDWPQAPLVYREQFLLIDQGENKVLFADGSEVLNSNYQLILASNAGIIAWDSENDSVFQYTSTNGDKELKLINAFSVIGEPRLTNQGYLWISQRIEGKESYSLYDEYGVQVLSYDIDGIDPNLIEVVWNDFVYLPIGEPNYIATQLGLETHFQMSELWIKGQNYKSPFTFQLCNKYAGDKMILLKYADKWIPFNGTDVEGNYLFDDILPGDKHLTPVKMGQKWYLFDNRLDSLIPLPYKQIHPIGMNNGRFYASMQEGGGINEAKWAFISYYAVTTTEALYQVPLLDVDNSVYNEKSRYSWNHQLNEVIRDGKRVLLNNYGKEVWVDPDNKATTIEDFFKVNFAFKFDNFKEVEKNQGYRKNQLSMHIKAIQSGIYVQLTNTKKTDEPVEIQDGYLQAVLEMKTTEGTWLKIGYLDPSWCGNSYYGAYFPAKKQASTIINLPKGDQSISVRVVLNENSQNRIVSNELWVKTNGARLWVKEYCGGFGCTDKE